MTDKPDESPPLPQKLYKFRAVETARERHRLRSILLKHKLYSPSPMSFNDPFDCRVPPIGSIDPSFARYLICPGNPNAATGALSQTEEAQLQQVLQATQDSIYTNGVLALGATRASTLMWSHYARDHRGVALEFDTAKWLEQMPCMNGQFHPVSYSEARIGLELTRAHFDQAQFFNATILTKDVCWKGEEEWRVITKKYGTLKFPISALTGVIFGCRAREMTKVKLKQICKRLPGVTFYQAKMREKEFGLDFEPC